jgi:hypothetical protein
VDAQMRDGGTSANERRKVPMGKRRDNENTRKSSGRGVVRVLPTRNTSHTTGATERTGLQRVER